MTSLLCRLIGSRKSAAMRAVLTLLHYSGLAELLRGRAQGRGVIFTLHSVSPEAPAEFDPNGILRITPAFLETVITTARQMGFDIVSLDEAQRRLALPEAGRPFACFTLDDGYRDNLVHAYPVFKRHAAPFAIYVPTEYPDGRGDLWWLVLEAAIRQLNKVAVTIGGARFDLATKTPAQKTAAFHALYWPLRALPEAQMREAIAALAAEAGVDPSHMCRDLIMTWDEIRALSKDPLVTIGAHTVHHRALAKLTDAEARAEITESVARIEAELGLRCRHFSFPYGDASAAGEREFAMARELGLATAVTTRKGTLLETERTKLCQLPRVSLNGDFQAERFVRVFLSGAPFLLVRWVKAALARVRGGNGALIAQVRPQQSG